MPFQYEQSTGILTHDGETLATGYSGNGEEMNNPSMQTVRGHGPIPQGTYTIGPPHADEVTGPVSMRLEPAPDTQMFGRADFLIHGDTAAMNHTASDGCIIMPHAVRIVIGSAVLAGDDQLEVVA